MADLGFVRAQLRGIADADTRRVLETVFTHILGNLRIGVPEHQARAENFQMYWMQSTSASDTGEFSIVHGLPSTPHYAIPVLELDRPGATLPALEVARAADGKRLYLKAKAGSTSAPFLLLTEW